MLQARGVGMADAVLRLAEIHLASLTSQIFKTVLAVSVLEQSPETVERV